MDCSKSMINFGAERERKEEIAIWTATVSLFGSTKQILQQILILEFLDDDITDDCACVKIIHKRHGFSAWYGWVNNCQGKKPNVPKCGPSAPPSS